MSFDLVCPNCGAPSASSVGICPYCKAVMTNKKIKNKDEHLISVLRKKYKEGQLPFVLRSCERMVNEKVKLKTNNSFLLFYLKVLFESDAPGSKIRSTISTIFLNDPGCVEAMDYLEIQEAKDLLSDAKNDPGEQKIKAIIKRSPNNAYAYFLLGSHLYWADQEYQQAIIHLEKAVKLHPGFIRAWGCLGALYKTIGNLPLAKKSFNKAASLESNVQMKKFFKSAIEA